MNQLNFGDNLDVMKDLKICNMTNLFPFDHSTFATAKKADKDNKEQGRLFE